MPRERASLRLPGKVFFAILKGVGIGVLIELPALLFAFMSAGAGHGDYGAARALFPVPMLLTILTDDTIGLLVGSLALLQFPLYGALIAWNIRRGFRRPLAPVAVLHIVAAVACFAGLLPNFS
jgi:hypothetical protein